MADPKRAAMGAGKGDGWYLGIVESIEHLNQMLQFENWDLIINRYTRNTNNSTKYKLE